MTEVYNKINSDYLDLCKQTVITEKVKVEILDDYDNTYGEITSKISSVDGNINVKYNQGVRRTCSLTIHDCNSDMIPNNEFSSFFINKRFKIYVGLYHKFSQEYKDEVIYWFSQGIFITTSCSYDIKTKTLSLSGIDKFGFFTKDLNQHNLQNTYRISYNSSLGDVISNIITLSMGNGVPTDSKTPIINTYLYDQKIPYDIEKTSNETIGDILIEIATAFNCDIYYNTEGHLVFEPNIVDEYRRQAPMYEVGNSDVSELSMNFDYSNVKNQITVTGDNSSGVVHSYTSQNQNPESTLRISNIGIKAGDVEETAMGYSEKRCMDYADYLLNKETMVKMSGKINSVPLPHLDVNRILRYLNNEDYIIDEINISLFPEVYNLSICNINELPMKSSLIDGCITHLPYTGEWSIISGTTSLGLLRNVEFKTEVTTPKEVNGVVVDGLGVPNSSLGYTEDGFKINYEILGLDKVKKLIISKNIIYIYKYTFHNYANIEIIKIPDSVISIGDYAFRGCSGLKSITIPDSVISIGDSVFYGCTGLTSIKISDSMTSIKRFTFYGCTGLKSINIPDSVTSIGNYAFKGCTGLTSIIIPDSVIEIGEYVFSECSNLTSITIPNSVISIGEETFSLCKSLTSITIPNSVTNIGVSAFRGCSGLTSITIPDSITKIEETTFFGCTGLTSIVIPSSITSIGNRAFGNCFALANIYYTGTKEQWDKVGKNSSGNFAWNKDMGRDVSGGTKIHYNYIA